MKKYHSISVVVCTRNRFGHLKKCVMSLLNQTLLSKEIIIVDDASKKAFSIYDIFDKNSGLPKLDGNIDIILIQNKGVSGVVASRNTGVNASSSDIIAFIDDDGFAHKDWLRQLVKNYKNDNILGVGGPVIEIGRKMKTPTFPVKNIAYIRNGKIISKQRIKKMKEKKYLPRKFVLFLQGGNMSFRKHALVHVKGGDINFTGNCYREETDLSMRVSRHGKLLFEPSAIAYHDTAKKGGFRDVIKFDINKFLYYMFRNTTYLFFKHFSFRKAFVFTTKSVKSQLKLLKYNKTGLTRDYFTIKSKNKAIGSIVIGVVSGFYNWFKLRKSEPCFFHSDPVSLACFRLTIAGGIIKLAELEEKTHLVKKIFGV
ncbi:MAG: glycosyltransferase family 2 protein [Candidatus Aenigmarchaeota archaeon]|nr:glycosyltransferase family 2 protein [Candidatus Aenigmarchaeota archaeon]